MTVQIRHSHALFLQCLHANTGGTVAMQCLPKQWLCRLVWRGWLASWSTMHISWGTRAHNSDVCANLLCAFLSSSRSLVICLLFSSFWLYPVAVAPLYLVAQLLDQYDWFFDSV